MLLYTAPQCATGGGFSQLDPLVHDFWYVHVSEGMPVWDQTLKVALQYAITPLIGLYAAINLAQRSRDWLGQFWQDYAIILAASIVIALLVARAGAVACLIAVPPLAWQLSRWLKAIRTMESPLPRMGAMIAVAFALLPALPLAISGLVLPAQAGVVQAATGHLKMSDCRIEDSADILNALPAGEVFAPLDIAPKLLFVSHHSVPATGHHRGNDTMRLVISTALGSTEDAQVTLQSRGSRYFALCPDLTEPTNYAFNAPDSFAADLLTERPPDWMEPIKTAQGTSFKLWRIKPAGSPSPAR